jgi:hypothetical protein
LTEAALVNRTVREYLAELEMQNPVDEPRIVRKRCPPPILTPRMRPKAARRHAWGITSTNLVDHSCIVVGVQATGARLSEESGAAEDMIARFAQWQDGKPQYLAADASYGNGEFLQWLMDRKITP